MTQINPQDARSIQWAACASVAVSIILILLKFFAWGMTHSVSLQGSLIDSLLDALASLINMVAIYHALKPADKEHRFGHGKLESLAALGQALGVGASALWVMVEAQKRFFHPEPIQESELGLIIMILAMGLILMLTTYQNRVVKQTGSSAIAADRIHYQSDLLINGVVILSLLSAKFLHIQAVDPLFGFLIGVYILGSAWKITVKAFNVLMDRELDDGEREQILSIVNKNPRVMGVRDLRTRSSGLQQFFQFYLVVSADLSLEEANRIAITVEMDVLEAYPKCQVMIRLIPMKDKPSVSS